MSRKRSPEVAVLEYFKTQPMEVAEMMLGLCKAEVKARQPQPVRAKRGRPPKAKDEPMAREDEEK